MHLLFVVLKLILETSTNKQHADCMQETQNVLFFKNYDLDNIKTPVKVKVLQQLLKQSGYDIQKTKMLTEGFTIGFRIGYQGSRTVKQTSPNLKLTVGSQVDLWNKVMKEVEKGRYVGPFEEIPFEHFIQSPIGLVPKDHGKDVRLIFHLSYPRSGKSVNSETPKELCLVKYPDFADAIHLCLKLTNGKSNKIVFSGKSDMKSAFRNLPMSKLDYMLLIMKATNPLDGKTYYFVDKCLPFGASISCSVFQDFSNAVAHILLTVQVRKL